MNYKKIAKVAVVVSAVVFLFMQFIQPNRDNPSFDSAKTLQSELAIPANISSLLDRGCKDCHSNKTVWPFYSYIAPASWLVSYDVMEGRKHFNMSEWGKYKFNKKVQKLSGIYQAVTDRSMPLPKYIPLHSEANFSDAERDTLARWAQTTAEKMMGGEEEE
ncbi:MAG: heme-binding domain-containing protein [Bacteroidota bacterium]